MAAGLDGLLDFLLSEIALCGVQGADSKDFHRFIDAYLHDAPNKHTTSPGQAIRPSSPESFNRNLYEKAWRWVTTHPDIRIFDGKKTYALSLSDLESLEHENGRAPNGRSEAVREARVYENSTPLPIVPLANPSTSLVSFGKSLRDRLVAEAPLLDEKSDVNPHHATHSRSLRNVEKHDMHKSTTFGVQQGDPPIRASLPDYPESPRKARKPRKIPGSTKIADQVFDELPSPIKCPRIFASQDRVWQAVSGHPIDLKRVPNMEFMCLCVIAIHGPKGVTQPDLIRITGQDKRSVPKRTDELAKKGYIEKRPIQDGKLRTSLCVHKKFLKGESVLNKPHNVDDVFGPNKFDFSGFVYLLHKLLKEIPLLPVRELRTKMGVPLQKWYKRSVRGSIDRLEASDYIKRVQAPRKGSKKLLLCIKALREPTEDDIQNLRFKRIVPERIEEDGELLEEDIEGDTLMRDLELDIMDESDLATDGPVDNVSRIPPQWTPDRILGNLIFDATESFGVDGNDTATLRDVTMGKFWKRSLESFVSRLADDWEQSQPPHLRHLSIIKDTMVTNDKKYAHFLYRTHANFQKAVDAGEVDWRNVSKEAQATTNTPNPTQRRKASLDRWGFPPINPKELYDQVGASDITQCRQGIVHRRSYGQRWDRALWEGLDPKGPGLSKKLSKPSRAAMSSTFSTPRAKQRQPPKTHGANDSDTPLPLTNAESPYKSLDQPMQPKKKAHPPIRLLTREQRLALGLSLTGRLGAEVEEQIREHRRTTGDPTSVPDFILQGSSDMRKLNSSATPHLTSREGEARGTHKAGRPSRALERQTQQEKGLAVQTTNKTKRTPRKNSRKVPLSEPSVTNDTITSLSTVPRKRVFDKPATEPRSPSAKRIQLRASTSWDDGSGRLAGAPFTSTRSEVAKRKLRDDHECRSSPAKKLRTTIRSRSLSELNTEASGSFAENKMVERRHLKIAAPGLYFDANATRSFGRGRPRKAFMAIVKSAHLHDFTWFKQQSNCASLTRYLASNWQEHIDTISQEATQLSGITPRTDCDSGVHPEEQQVPPHSETRTKAHHPFGKHPKTGQFSDQLSPQLSVLSPAPRPDISEPVNLNKDTSAQTEEQSSTTLPQNSRGMTGPELQHQYLIPPQAETLENATSTGRKKSGMAAQQICTPVGTTLNESLQKTIIEQPERSQQQNPLHTRTNIGVPMPPLAPRGVTDVHTNKSVDPTFTADKTAQPRVSPAGWVAINMQSAMPSSGYQSPYTTLPVQSVFSDLISDDNHNIPSEGNEITEKDSRHLLTSEPPASMHRLADPLLDNPKLRQNKRKLKEDRSVIIGKGNVFNTRTSITRYILKLCNGVFPLNGEIVYIYREVWKERAPKRMACPERSTIIRTLNDMISDPAQALVRYTFQFLSHTGNTAKRALVAYSHLAVTSPEVQRAYHGIRTAHPHKYFPPEVIQYVRDVQKPRTNAVFEVDESVKLPETPSAAAKSLQRRIGKAIKEREKRYLQRQQQAVVEQQERNRPVRRGKPSAGTGQSKITGHGRARLAGLNAPGQRKTKTTSSLGMLEWPQDLAKPSLEVLQAHPSMESNLNKQHTAESLHEDADSPPHSDPESISDYHDIGDDEEAEYNKQEERMLVTVADSAIQKAFTKPAIRFYASNGTFSTEFHLFTKDLNHSATKSGVTETSVLNSNLEKRWPSKQAQISSIDSVTDLDNGEPGPTLAERLTGLTGNVNEPDYYPPTKKQKTFPTWSERKEKRQHRAQPKEKKYVEDPDHVQRFKKLLCTLVVASCMSGKKGSLNWDIVIKVFNHRRFDQEKTKKIWRWIQENMAVQLSTLTENFQSAFLNAYEEGKLGSIEDPETYDWESLVCWTMANCRYTLAPLPQALEDLNDYEIDASEYQVFSRPSWYRSDVAALNRSHRLNSYAYAAPLHAVNQEAARDEDTELKARSWVRANISTPNALYDKKMAHDKLQPLGESTLAGVVQDLVEARLLRTWKIKRLRPGRNYSFAPGFALKYRRVFELNDFMAAVQLKKDLDTAFASNRTFTISRTAEDGAVMAILTLANDDRIRLVPNLPPINNELGVPNPRISVWGFSEGDYVHRAIDRSSLFWEVQAVATSSYTYGNPLQPNSMPDVDHPSTTWENLPAPPIPCHDDPDALLPIWSTVNGQHINYPWWNRVLNLVIQSLMFQPGASAIEIFGHCPEHTTELFEIQLVLGWLEKVSAVKHNGHGTYEVGPGFWAVFGDKLIDEENDEFGQKLKRKGKAKLVESTWRTEYNLRFSTLQKSKHTIMQQGHTSSDDEGLSEEEDLAQSLVLEQIMKNSRSQYHITKRVLQKSAPEQIQTAESTTGVDQQIYSAQRATSLSKTARGEADNSGNVHALEDVERNVEMEDVDAEGEEDEDYAMKD